MTTTKNEIFWLIIRKLLFNGGWGGGLTFGGGNKNSVRRSTEGEGGSRVGERIRFVKQIVHKYTQVTIPNLLNG